MGNICRSPSAEGVMRAFLEEAGLSDQVTVDSAGTHGYHAGKAPDQRAIAAAKRRGYDLTSLRARQISKQDLDDFDLVLAMDLNNLEFLQSMGEMSHLPKIRLLMNYARDSKVPIVPDPYYRSAADFEQVLDYIEDACKGLIRLLTQTKEVAR